MEEKDMTFLTIVIIILAIRALGNVERSSRIRNTQKIRVCRHCHEFIPYGASICPYCHNEPGRDWTADREMGPSAFGEALGRIFWGMVLFIAVVMMIGCLA